MQNFAGRGERVYYGMGNARDLGIRKRAYRLSLSRLQHVKTAALSATGLSRCIFALCVCVWHQHQHTWNLIRHTHAIYFTLRQSALECYIKFISFYFWQLFIIIKKFIIIYFFLVCVSGILYYKFSHRRRGLYAERFSLASLYHPLSLSHSLVPPPLLFHPPLKRNYQVIRFKSRPLVGETCFWIASNSIIPRNVSPPALQQLFIYFFSSSSRKKLFFFFLVIYISLGVFLCASYTLYVFFRQRKYIIYKIHYFLVIYNLLFFLRRIKLTCLDAWIILPLANIADSETFTGVRGTGIESLSPLVINPLGFHMARIS